MDTSRRATSGGMSLLVIVLLASMAQSIAGQPLITWIAPDGTITWTNTSTQCVAVVEEFSPGTSGEWVTVYAELPTSLVSQAQVSSLQRSGAVPGHQCGQFAGPDQHGSSSWRDLHDGRPFR